MAKIDKKPDIVIFEDGVLDKTSKKISFKRPINKLEKDEDKKKLEI